MADKRLIRTLIKIENALHNNKDTSMVTQATINWYSNLQICLLYSKYIQQKYFFKLIWSMKKK